MPILHIQFSGQHKALDGTLSQVPSPIVLRDRGPCIQVTINIAETIAEQLVQQGKPVPPPVSGMALVDSGASSTCIDDGLAQRLGVPAIDVVQVSSASHAATLQNVYPIRIEVVGTGIKVNVPRAIGAALDPQGIIALIGRDFLQHCTLFYNGVTGEITLSI